MRIILFALLITACAPKIETTTPPRAQNPEFQRVLNADADFSAQYSKYTQSAFAILWPLSFDDEGKKLLTTVLDTADELQATHTNYTQISNRVKRASKKHQCECVLTGICERELSPEVQAASLEVCTGIESEQLENDERLAKLVHLQDRLKSSVLNMGGYWLEVSTPPVYNFSTGKIDFKGARFFNKERKRIDLKDNAFWVLDTVKVEGALKVQGELKIKHGGRVYRGELGFQLPERGE